MRTRVVACLGVALAVVVAFACTDQQKGSVTEPAVLFSTTGVTECDVIDFNGFSHGDAITSVSLFGGDATLNVTAYRNRPEGPVNATAYDTELWATEGDAPNNTHWDTQKNIWCGDCDGIMAVVPDPNFAWGGDDTQGGSITFTGFGSGYTWTIPSYAAVDDDGPGHKISLYLDGDLVAASTHQGNATVEIVYVDDSAVSAEAKFVLEGSNGIDNIEVCRTREELLGRFTGGGGQIIATNSNGEDVRITRGFTLHCDVTLSNNLEINWPGYRWHIEKEYFIHGTPICYDAPGVDPEPPPAPFDTFEGKSVGRLNNVDGAYIHFILQDAGEPGGKNDKMMITIWDVGADPHTEAPILYVPFDFLDHGNLQAHYDQPHGCNVNKC